MFISLQSFSQSVDIVETENHRVFQPLETDLKEISKKDFNKYLKAEHESCDYKDLNLRPETSCDEICETWVYEIGTDKKFLLPCQFDIGVFGDSFSPGCKFLVVCSTYDGPDYKDYYENRAEIYFYAVTGKMGMQSMECAFTYFSKDWSIADYAWISDTEIAIKTYVGQRYDDDTKLDYKYYTLTVSNMTSDQD